MGKLTEWVKLNAKEGANIAEFEELEKTETIIGIDSKEKALDFMFKNPVFTSALDYTKQKAVEAGVNNYKNGDELKNLLKAEHDKTAKELNPDLTPEQKRLAEMEKTIADMKSNESKLLLEKQLRAKAKELGYPESKAERFAVYGEQAFAELENESKFLKEQTETLLNSEIKKRFGDTTPPPAGNTDPSKIVTRQQFDAMATNEKTTFLKDGGKLKDN
jgi:hypothetical protein